MKKTLFLWSLVALGAATLGGCGGVRLADSVDLTFNWGPLTGPSDDLHTPYVAGADFRLFTIGVDPDATVGWQLTSSDPSALRVDTTEDGRADVTAVGPGVSTVTILDVDGRAVHTAEVEVRQPDRAELLAHGPLILRRPELQEDWDEIRVVVGGSATFEVEWYAGNERLHGNGALTADVDGDLVVTPRRTFLFEDREWVTFTPGSLGTYEVTLRANGLPVRTVRVVAVGADAVARVELHGMDESRARSGDYLAVLTQTYDAEGRALFGVDYAWELDGTRQDGHGDLYRYEYAPGRERVLCAMYDAASAGAVTSEVTIQASEGFVDSTNRLGCSSAGAGLPRGSAWAAVALFGLVLVRRRR